MLTNLIHMRTRIRTNSVAKVVIESVGESQLAKETKQKQMFGEIVRGIMTELNLTWDEAKAEYRKRRVESAIKRDMQKLNII